MLFDLKDDPDEPLHIEVDESDEENGVPNGTLSLPDQPKCDCGLEAVL